MSPHVLVYLLQSEEYNEYIPIKVVYNQYCNLLGMFGRIQRSSKSGCSRVCKFPSLLVRIPFSRCLECRSIPLAFLTLRVLFVNGRLGSPQKAALMMQLSMKRTPEIKNGTG